MDVVFQLQSIEFEWDEEKYSVNLSKPGVKFENGAEVFFDPFHQTGDASVDNENREFIIGYSFSDRLLLVVFVERGLRTRIVSARNATLTERKHYKNPDEIVTEEGFVVKFRERESEEVSLKIPKDVMASLEKVAKKRDLTVPSLLKLYIGQNLRQDIANYFSNEILEKTEAVLSRHLQNKEEISEIVREIKLDSVA